MEKEDVEKFGPISHALAPIHLHSPLKRRERFLPSYDQAQFLKK